MSPPVGAAAAAAARGGTSAAASGDWWGFLAERGVDAGVIDVLLAEKVTAELAADLSADDLKEIGITAWGDRKAVLAAASAFNDGGGSAVMGNRPRAASGGYGGGGTGAARSPPAFMSRSGGAGAAAAGGAASARPAVPRGNSQSPAAGEYGVVSATDVLSTVTGFLPGSKQVSEKEKRAVKRDLLVAKYADQNLAAVTITPAMQRKAALNNWTPEETAARQLEKNANDAAAASAAKASADKRRAGASSQAAKEAAYIEGGATVAARSVVEGRRAAEADLQGSIDPGSCHCSLRCSDASVANGGKFVVYRIEIEFASEIWYVDRKLDDFATLDGVLRKELRAVWVDCLPRKAKRALKDEIVRASSREGLDAYLQFVDQIRPQIFQNAVAQSFFARCFAPVRLGDYKDANFKLPFKLS